MDRSPFPPRVQSHSTPAFIPQFDGNSNSREEDRSRVGAPARASTGAGHNLSDGAIASHFLSQPPEAFGGQTWLDFLRETGVEDGNGTYAIFPNSQNPNVGVSSAGVGMRPRTLSRQSTETSSSDRKRRLTAPESPGRRRDATFTPPNPPRLARPLDRPASNSANTPIDLLSSPATPRNETSRPPFGVQTRSDSDIMLPSWQPDAEVSRCPVCRNQFTFFYRKHHCRKCGRVVCANCSPHRITIPRQFIVHPPELVSNIIDLTGDFEDQNTMSTFGPYRNPALGGGEEVRVCNPCVPDPNFSPPPQRRPSDQEGWRFPAFDPNVHPSPPPPLPSDSTRPRFTSSAYPSHSRSMPRYRFSQGDVSQSRPEIVRPRPDPFRDNRVSFHNRSRVSDLFPPPNDASDQQTQNHPHHTSRRPSSHYYAQRITPLHHQHHHSHSTSAVQTGYRSLLDINAPLPPSPMPPPQPRREIAEEDECPVCGEELPPKGPEGSEVDREAHVQECIASHLGGASTSPPAPSTAIDAAIAASAATPAQAQGPTSSSISSSLPNPRTRGMSNAASASPSPMPTASPRGNGESSRPRRSTHSNRMLVYHASEKDCIGEDGEAQECVICFEEFEQGDEMGRLMCLCKFHRTCIRKWWETKGPGSCPTHQLHD